jgi:hypothetical protein
MPLKRHKIEFDKHIPPIDSESEHPSDWVHKLAERTGLEPATSYVTGRRSNQLNYRSYLRKDEL